MICFHFDIETEGMNMHSSKRSKKDVGLREKSTYHHLVNHLLFLMNYSVILLLWGKNVHMVRNVNLHMTFNLITNSFLKILVMNVLFG